MNKKLLYALNLVIAFALIGLVFWYAGKAEASSILQGTTNLAAATSSTAAEGDLTYTSGVSVPQKNWYIDRVDVYVSAKVKNAGADTWKVTLTEFGTSTPHVSDNSLNTDDLTIGWNSFYFATPVHFGESTFSGVQEIKFQRSSSGTADTTTNKYVASTTASIFNLTKNGTTLGKFDANFVVYGIDAGTVIEGGTVSRIVSQNSPTNGDTTSSGVVTFDFDYYNNDTDDELLTVAGVDIRDMTTSFEYAPLEQDILISGGGSFSQIANLEHNHLHLWRPFLRNASSTRIIYGTWHSFDVVGPSAPFESYIDPETGLPLNASSTSFWDFLNVPELLKTKAPTGYIYQIGSIINSISDIAATSTPTLTMSFVGTSSNITQLKNVPMFSYTLVTQLIPPSMITILRGIMLAVLYIGLAFGIIHHSHNMFS